MINKQLVEYFSYYLRKGRNPEDLVKEALKKGWPKTYIKDSLVTAKREFSKVKQRGEK